MTNYRAFLKHEEKECMKLLKKAPEGKLLLAKNGKYQKWYVSKDQEIKYLSKTKRVLAEQLAMKKITESKLLDIRKELYATNSYLEHCINGMLPGQKMLENENGIRKLAPVFTEISEELEKWIREEYPKSNKHREGLIFKASSGNMVRSKSECLIDAALCKHEIPFRYEQEVLLGDRLIHPDFIVRNKRTGQLFYWEHFGMMDNNKYVNDFHNKLNLYISMGIIPGVNLIMTFETSNHPLDTSAVEMIISEYLL